MTRTRTSVIETLLVLILAFAAAPASAAAPPPIDLNDPIWQQISSCGASAITAFIAEQQPLPEYQRFQEEFTGCAALPEPELTACFTDASVRYARWQETLPGYGQYQRAVSSCYIGTPYERLVPSCARPDAAVPCPDPTKIRAYFDALGYSKVMEESFAEFSRRVPSLTSEQANRLQDCLWEATWVGVERREPAGEQTLRAYATCYEGTPGYESFVRTYTYGAAVAVCAQKTLGAVRIGELGRRGALPSVEEAQVVRKCAEATAAGAAAIAVVNTVAGVGPGTLLLYGQFLLSIPYTSLSMRRRKSWGTVVNGLTSTPIDLAVLRLFSGDRLRRTQVTDQHGRYLFIVDEGTYNLTPKKSGFRFPVSVAVDGYRGGAIRIAATDGAIAERVPLEPETREPNLSRLRWQRIGRGVHRTFAIAVPLVGIGAFAVERTTLIGILAAVQIVSFLLAWRLRHRMPRATGMVRDAAARPISHAIVRLFTQPFNKLAETQVTTRSGRYGFLVGPGTYTITVEKPEVGHARQDDLTVRAGAKPTALAPNLTLRAAGRAQS